MTRAQLERRRAAWRWVNENFSETQFWGYEQIMQFLDDRTYQRPTPDIPNANEGA